MEGKNYDPYVKGHHFGSKGVVGRIYNRQIERTQHTISNLELKYLTLLKWSKVPTDIREQFALPLEETLAIAEELGIPPPQVFAADASGSYACPVGAYADARTHSVQGIGTEVPEGCLRYSASGSLAPR